MQTEPNNGELDNTLPEEPTNQENLEETSVESSNKLEAELQESKEKYLRLYADFENFRRRTAKEKLELIQNASESLIKDILPIVDDFERAIKSFDQTTDTETIKAGVELIYHKLVKLLESKGVTPIESLGQDFDVEKHECITQFDAGEKNKGKVIDQVEKGYRQNDKVIRYAKVIVGS